MKSTSHLTMNLLLRVCESSTSHVSIDRFAFCSNLSARISSSVRRWIRKRKRRSVIIIELCESYDASSKRQARDELVVMTRDATENEISLLNMFLTWKRTFLAYDDVTLWRNQKTLLHVCKNSLSRNVKILRTVEISTLSNFKQEFFKLKIN